MTGREALYTVYGPKTAFEMSWLEAEALMKETDVGVIILGATEQHGVHNPMCADTLIPLEGAKRAALLLEPEGVKVFIATPIPFGMSHHHLRFPGSVALQPETAIDLVFDVATCLVDQGMAKLVLMVGHTSQEQTAVLSLAALKLQQRYGTMTSIFNWAAAARDVPYATDEYLEARKRLEEMKGSRFFDAHGGEGETAMMMAICPALVHEDLMEAAPSERGADRYAGLVVGRKGAHPGPKSGLLIPSPGPYDDFYMKDGRSLGHIGDPTVATAEFGEQWLKVISLALAELIRRLHGQE